MKKVIVMMALALSATGCGGYCATLEQMAAAHNIFNTPISDFEMCDIEITIDPEEEYGPGPGAF